MEGLVVKRSVVSWLAWRHLRARNGRSLSFMTSISIAGVAVGVATLIVVLSVMGGFEHKLQQKMLRGEPHLEVFHKDLAIGFSSNDLPLESIRNKIPEAEAIGFFTRADVVLKHRKNLQAAELYGVMPDKDLWIFENSMIEGDSASLAGSHQTLNGEGPWPGIILGEGLVANLGVNLGEEVLVINPSSAIQSSTPDQGSVRRYVLTGIFRSNDAKFDGKWAAVSIDEGRRYLPDFGPELIAEAYVTGLALRLRDPFQVSRIAERFKEYAWAQTVSWEQSNQALLFALKLEKFAMGSILMLIVLVAAFSISGTIMMTVHHRRKQVAIFRAMGMSRSDVSHLFMGHGLLIGTVGIIAGLMFGLGVCYVVQRWGLVSLPNGAYAQKQLPVKFLPMTYLVIVVSAWLFSLFAAIYPALMASRQSPSEGLRAE